MSLELREREYDLFKEQQARREYSLSYVFFANGFESRTHIPLTCIRILLLWTTSFFNRRLNFSNDTYYNLLFCLYNVHNRSLYMWNNTHTHEKKKKGKHWNKKIEISTTIYFTVYEWNLEKSNEQMVLFPIEQLNKMDIWILNLSYLNKNLYQQNPILNIHLTIWYFDFWPI